MDLFMLVGKKIKKQRSCYYDLIEGELEGPCENGHRRRKPVVNGRYKKNEIWILKEGNFKWVWLNKEEDPC